MFIPTTRDPARPGPRVTAMASMSLSVMFDRVRVGELELSQVEGIVIEADTGPRVLLGMSFLRRLQMSQQDNVMVLRQRH